MLGNFFSAVLLCVCYTMSVTANTVDSIPATVADNTGLELVSRQFAFTEGPAADRKGNVYFTDQPDNTIWKYDTAGTLSIFMGPCGRSNGMYFDRQGNLVTCADEKNQLWSISPQGKVTVLVSNFEGHRLNGPNDVWIAPNGGIYFTDPYYQRDYWTRTQPDIKEERVYYLAPGAKKPVALQTNVTKPNGVIGTHDGKTLYIADIGASKVYRYHIEKNGSLSHQTLVSGKTVDGFAIDAHGNVYLCGNGITVIDKEGKEIGVITVPEDWTANACFGGKNKNVLFITAGSGFYKLRMKVIGGE